MSEASSHSSTSLRYEAQLPAHLQGSSGPDGGAVDTLRFDDIQGMVVPPVVLPFDAPAPGRSGGDSGSQQSHREVDESEAQRLERLFNQQRLLEALEEEENEEQKREDEEIGVDEEHLKTATTMETEHLASNKRQMEGWLQKWLHSLRSYFLFVHIAYICTVALVSAILMYLLEQGNTDINFTDAVFAAASFVSCTGLVATDVQQWRPETYAVRMMTMILGGNCFMSGTMPLLRWFTLRRLKEETIIDEGDRYVLKRWKLRKRNFIDRLETTSILCATNTYFYWSAIHLGCFAILSLLPNNMMRVGEVMEHVIAAFQNCCSLPLNYLADNGVFIFVIAFLVAAGNTLFPLFLRIQFHGLLGLMQLYKTVWARWERRKHKDDEEEYGLLDDGGESGSGTLVIGRVSGMGSTYRARQSGIVPALSGDATWDEGRAMGVSKWELGVRTILQHEDPGVFHPFLFSWGQTRYILYTFLCLNGVQMLPFLIQQWDVTLAPFGGAQKFLVAFCQSVYVRFAGVTIVNNLLFSNVHTMWMLFAMYIPVIPIPGDRGKRKWKEMVRAGAWRLLSSRIFLLFFSMSVIIWIEEKRLEKQVEGTPFGITTRVLFELVSGYSTSGMSLPLGNNGCFSASLTQPSQWIIAVNMIIGRHRWMDLGIDIGLDQLEESDRAMQRILKEREEWQDMGASVSQAPSRHVSLMDRFRGKSRGPSVWEPADVSAVYFRNPPPAGSSLSFSGHGASTLGGTTRASNVRQLRRSILRRASFAQQGPPPGQRFPLVALGDQLGVPEGGSNSNSQPSPRLAHSRHGSNAPASKSPRLSPSTTPRTAALNQNSKSRTGSRYSPAVTPRTAQRRGAATRTAAASILESRSSMNTVRKSNSNEHDE